MVMTAPLRVRSALSCSPGASTPDREDPQRGPAEDLCAILIALRGELLHWQTQRVAVPFAGADRRVVAAPHHPARPERLVRQVEQWRERKLEREGRRDRRGPPCELPKAVDLDR